MQTLLYIAVLLFSFYAGIIHVGAQKKTVPFCTIIVAGVLVFCFTLQFALPNILILFQRNTGLIRAGEWWRLITALFFQDGGLVGGLSNIFSLALIGSVAEQMYTKRQWLAIYFGTGFLTGLVALFWQPIGAGNSIAVFGLAGAICVSVFFKEKRIGLRALAIAGLTSTVALFTLKDIHGAAFLIGVALCGSMACNYFPSNIFPQRRKMI